ncbi:MAG TPA: CPBP family intramembrane glutamic endopeptidase [Polyangiaceae bacterium]
MTGVAVVFVVVFASYAAAFRPELAGENAFWWTFGLPHAALALFAVDRMRRRGTLLERITPRGGDISIGAITALLLLAASWYTRPALAPAGTPRHGWLLLLFLQIGDPDDLQHSVVLTSALCLIALAEELIWRGYVLDELNERFGNRKGWIAAAALYALAALPTVYTLRVPGAGPNPLLVFAAFGCGLLWTFLAARFGRLLPGAVSHVAFSYFSAVQFRWPV